MLNLYHNDWVFIKGRSNYPEFNKPVYILVEHDVLDEVNKDSNYPFVRKACLDQTQSTDYIILIWKLSDFDPETEEEILQQCYTVIAWRYNPK